MMTPTIFREESFRRARQNETDVSYDMARLALYALGLTGEAGEVADEIKKVIFHDKPLDATKIVNECGDVLWHLDRMLFAVGATMEQAMEANTTKLAKRYPDGFDDAERKYGFTIKEGA